MKVVIAEKPSVARDIAKVLGATEKKEGYIEGAGYQVTWAYGHLVGLDKPETYQSDPWKLDNLPIIPGNFNLVLTGDSGTVKQFNIIKKLFTGSTEIIVATDAGREGELIFRYIYELSGSKKPFKRLWISSLTNEAIIKGFNNLTPGTDYDNLYNAAKGRSEADWLVGMNGTMALTSAANTGKTLSIGRVQTPTLALIANAYLKNKNFKPEPFISLSINLIKDSVDFKATYALKLTNKAQASLILAGLSDSILCTEKEEKEVIEGAPLLYDLSSLQQDGNKKHGFKAQKTLDLIQSLYEKHKFLSYPRTNSKYLSTDMVGEAEQIFKRIAANTPAGNIKNAAEFLISSPLSKKPFDNEKITDHHAIIPTNKNHDLSALTPDERIVYDLVVLRFVQAFMAPAKRLKTVLSFAFNDSVFESKGSQIIFPGFLLALAPVKKILVEDDEDAASEQTLPSVLKGDILTITKKTLEEKLTKPSPLLNEASLLRLMETAGRQVDDLDAKEALKDIGIGTSATRAGVIERLFSLTYIENKGKSLIPSTTGLAVYELIKDKEIGSAELTGKWEQKLNGVAAGTYSIADFEKEIISFTKFFTAELKIIGKSLVIAPGKDELICPMCNKGQVRESPKAWGCSKYKEGCTFTIWKTTFGKTLTDKNIQQIILKGESAKLKFKSKEGKEYEAKLGLNKEFKVYLLFQNK